VTLELPSPDFELDAFQKEANAAIDAGRSVLVAAPTGSGKTMAAEHALDQAVQGGKRAFYTSPIKALANQKFRDFSRRYGADRVGLLTGDNSINGDAQVVVMTTEVLRNMLYVDSAALQNLAWVVLDEVHYLQDRYRGPVWEEVILNLAPDVGLVSLSATVSNLEELGDWLRTVRGPTDVILSTKRPVPLDEMLAVAEGERARVELVPLFVDRGGKSKLNPAGAEMDAPRRDRFRDGAKRLKFRTPHRSELVARLRKLEMAPVIFFVFSRKGCDEAARQCAEVGLDFTTSEQKDRIADIILSHLSGIDPRDQASLEIDAWTERAIRGIASHHAGLVPAMKEAIETAFVEGLITVVFATETLALGINMPARTVVIENLSKFNGETHEILTPLQYTQLVGRAGRRGMDDVGHAVTAWSPFVQFEEVASLAASREFPLRSAFRPTYNMAANLVRRMSRGAAETTVARSFAQFQVDREAVRGEADLERLRRRMNALSPDIACEFGDTAEYQLWLQTEDNDRDREAIMASLNRVKPGDVIAAPGVGYAAVLSTASRKKRGSRLRIVTADDQSRMIDAEDLLLPAEVVTRLELPQPFAPKDPSFHAAVAEGLRGFGLGTLVAAGSAHPVAQCPEWPKHLDALEQQERLESRAERIASRLARRQGRLVAEFERVVSLLEYRGYVEGWELTPAGDLLTSLYHESDLLIADVLREGVFDGLDFGEVAALASCFTYEHRSKNPPPPPALPTPAVGEAFNRSLNMAKELNRTERDVLGAARTREPEAGFAEAAFLWSTGASLESAIEEVDSGGDFVRNVRQLLDLLRQLAASAPDRALRRAAGEAAAGLDRGVVRAGSDIAELVQDDAVSARDASADDVSMSATTDGDT